MENKIDINSDCKNTSKSSIINLSNNNYTNSSFFKNYLVLNPNNNNQNHNKFNINNKYIMSSVLKKQLDNNITNNNLNKKISIFNDIPNIVVINLEDSSYNNDLKVSYDYIIDFYNETPISITSKVLINFQKEENKLINNIKDKYNKFCDSLIAEKKELNDLNKYNPIIAYIEYLDWIYDNYKSDSLRLYFALEYFNSLFVNYKILIFSNFFSKTCNISYEETLKVINYLCLYAKMSNDTLSYLKTLIKDNIFSNNYLIYYNIISYYDSAHNYKEANFVYLYLLTSDVLDIQNKKITKSLYNKYTEKVINKIQNNVTKAVNENALTINELNKYIIERLKSEFNAKYKKISSNNYKKTCLNIQNSLFQLNNNSKKFNNNETIDELLNKNKFSLVIYDKGIYKLDSNVISNLLENFNFYSLACQYIIDTLKESYYLYSLTKDNDYIIKNIDLFTKELSLLHNTICIKVFTYIKKYLLDNFSRFKEIEDEYISLFNSIKKKEPYSILSNERINAVLKIKEKQYSEITNNCEDKLSRISITPKRCKKETSIKNNIIENFNCNTNSNSDEKIVEYKKRLSKENIAAINNNNNNNNNNIKDFIFKSPPKLNKIEFDKRSVKSNKDSIFYSTIKKSNNFKDVKNINKLKNIPNKLNNKDNKSEGSFVENDSIIKDFLNIWDEDNTNQDKQNEIKNDNQSKFNKHNVKSTDGQETKKFIKNYRRCTGNIVKENLDESFIFNFDENESKLNTSEKENVNKKYNIFNDNIHIQKDINFNPFIKNIINKDNTDKSSNITSNNNFNIVSNSKRNYNNFSNIAVINKSSLNNNKKKFDISDIKINLNANIEKNSFNNNENITKNFSPLQLNKNLNKKSLSDSNTLSNVFISNNNIQNNVKNQNVINLFKTDNNNNNNNNNSNSLNNVVKNCNLNINYNLSNINKENNLFTKFNINYNISKTDDINNIKSIAKECSKNSNFNVLNLFKNNSNNRTTKTIISNDCEINRTCNLFKVEFNERSDKITNNSNYINMNIFNTDNNIKNNNNKNKSENLNNIFNNYNSKKMSSQNINKNLNLFKNN